MFRGMANELPGYSPASLGGRALLALPFVFRHTDGRTYRFSVVEVNPDNHNTPADMTLLRQVVWATGDHFTKAGIRWRRETSGLPEPTRDARGPDIGTAAWERNRANTFEAIINAIQAVILMQGGFQWVQAENGHGERQESIPEAVARLCRSGRPLPPPVDHTPRLAGETLDFCPECRESYQMHTDPYYPGLKQCPGCHVWYSHDKLRP